MNEIDVLKLQRLHELLCRLIDVETRGKEARQVVPQILVIIASLIDASMEEGQKVKHIIAKGGENE